MEKEIITSSEVLKENALSFVFDAASARWKSLADDCISLEEEERLARDYQASLAVARGLKNIKPQEIRAVLLDVVLSDNT